MKKKKEDLFINPFEVLLIYDELYKKWVNPEIEDIINWSKVEDGYITKDIFRIWIENENESSAQIVAYIPELQSKIDKIKFDEETYSDKFNKVFTGKFSFENIAMQLWVTLFEDVWTPGNEQFCFTEFGERLSDKFINFTSIKISPDIALAKEETENGTNYWFDT
jgi:hypothetical protein